MSIDEPTMLGDTPEEKMRAQQRRKRIRTVALLLVVVLAVGIAVSLLPTTSSKNFTVDRENSRCAAGGSLSCTLALDPRSGYTATISLVKSVQINGTNAASSSVKMSGNEILVMASIPLATMTHCLPDVGCSLGPATAGDVVVFLTDGTTVSAVIGATNGE